MAKKEQFDEAENELLENDINIDFSPLWEDEPEGGLLKFVPVISLVLTFIILVLVVLKK